MNNYPTRSENMPELKMKSSLSSEWIFDNPIAVPKSPPWTGRTDSEFTINKYKDLLKSDSTDSVIKENGARFDHPFDFFDEDEFLFGSNLSHKNIAHVGDDVTKLMQMAQEPWPDNVKLFQPYEVEQILLPDNASCLAVQAFLKMCHLPFEVEMRWNAEFMSPSGRVPFIKCGAFVVSELEPIVQFCGNKGATLTAQLSTEERAEMRAYMSLITNVLLNAELYISWLDAETYSSVTRARNASVYPWPLGWLQTRSKRSAVTKRLKALNWHDKTMERVLSDVEQCCNSLSQRLGDKEYFFGTPTPLDAWIYGHIRALLNAVGPKAHLMIRPITTALLRHTVRMAGLTDMKLQPQEEYLVSQALAAPQSQLRYASSPERTASSVRSERAIKRSRVAFKARDRLGKGDTVFGFKPFVAKQIVVMASKDKANSSDCRLKQNHEDDKREAFDSENGIKYIIEEIVNKLGEMDDASDATEERDDKVTGVAILDEKNDERKEFEIIAECVENNEDLESNYVIVNDSTNPMSSNEQFSTSEYQMSPIDSDNFDSTCSLRFWDTSDAVEDNQDSLAAYARDNLKTNELSETFQIIEEEVESSV